MYLTPFIEVEKRIVAAQLDDRLIVRYLLGEASEQEEQELEERYFADDDYFEHLNAVEEELIDAYVSGELSAGDRKRFEQHFLASSKRRQRVAFAQALLSSAARRHEAKAPAVRGGERRPWWRVWPSLGQIPVMQELLAAGLVLLLIGGSWSVVQSRRLRDQLDQMRAEQTVLRSEGHGLRQQIEQQRTLQEQLNAAFERERDARSRLEQAGVPQSRVMASFILMPGTLRSPEDTRPLLIRPGTDVVQLQLDLEAEGGIQYRVAVRTAEDQEVWSQDGLQSRQTPAGRAVVMSLPAVLLPPGDYIVMLRTVTVGGNVEDAGQYSFKTIRR
jgi:hypothetical protein